MGVYNLWEIVQRPEEVAAHGLVAILIGMFCLIAIWVGVTQRHWFVRTTIICGTLLIFIPIRAYQPLVLIAFTMAFLIVGWNTARWRTERQRQVLSATKS